MIILVDTNVLIDVLEEDPQWFGWSSSKLDYHKGTDVLAINQLILAEVSVEFETQDELERALPRRWIQRIELPWEAAFIAGRRFLEYRRRGGARQAPMPDFYIGAHAQVAGYTLLTRDADFYRRNFLEVPLISP